MTTKVKKYIVVQIETVGRQKDIDKAHSAIWKKITDMPILNTKKTWQSDKDLYEAQKGK